MSTPYSLILSDGTTSIDFAQTDGYGITGFEAPNPERRLLFVGEGGRDGADLLDVLYDNRVIAVEYWFKTETTDMLHAEERRIHRMMGRATDYSRKEWGRLVTLTYQPGDASLSAIADIITGELIPLDLEQGWLEERHDLDRMSYFIGKYRLELLCRPTLRGARNTVSSQTLYNSLRGIEHRYTYDQSAGTYSPNLAGRVDGPLFATDRAGSTELTIAAGDGVFLGDTLGTFGSINFGVRTPLAYSVAPAWTLYYWNGTAYAGLAFTLFDDENPLGIGKTAGQLAHAFLTAGEKRIQFAIPAGWAANTVNAVLANWLFLSVDTVGTVTQYPSIQWGPFRHGRGLGLIDASQVPGDLPARVELKFTNDSGVDLRGGRVAVVPNLRKPYRSVPAIRHPAEFATGQNAGAVDAAAPSARGGAAIKIGTARTVYGKLFDGINSGHLEWATTNIVNLGSTGGTDNAVNFTADFWFRPEIDPADPESGLMSPRTQPVWGSWDGSTDKRKLLIVFEDRRLAVWLSRNGRDIIRYATPYRKNGQEQATESRKKRLRHPTELQPGRWYFCRVTRAGHKIKLAVDSGGGSDMNVRTFDTKATANRNDTLGINPLYNTAPAVFRAGAQVSVPDADTATGESVMQLAGTITQLRVSKKAAGDQKGKQNAANPENHGEYSGNDTTNNTLGLFEFRTTPGLLVNSQTTGTPMANPTQVGTVTDVTGKWQSDAKKNIHAIIKASWSLVDTYRGPVRVLAIGRADSNNSMNVDVFASQGGFQLLDNESGRKLSLKDVWQILDLGTAQLPYQRVSSGYSTLGANKDGTDWAIAAENIGLATLAENLRQVDNFWIDEVLLVPLDWWYATYDSGDEAARAIPNGGGMLWSSLTEPPQVGQFDTAGLIFPNPDMRGDPLGSVPLLQPGVENWVFADVIRHSNGESNPADKVLLVATIEPRYLSVDAVP